MTNNKTKELLTEAIDTWKAADPEERSLTALRDVCRCMRARELFNCRYSLNPFDVGEAEQFDNLSNSLVNDMERDLDSCMDELLTEVEGYIKGPLSGVVIIGILESIIGLCEG